VLLNSIKIKILEAGLEKVTSVTNVRRNKVWLLGSFTRPNRRTNRQQKLVPLL
jgi:hypothetical protein